MEFYGPGYRTIKGAVIGTLTSTIFIACLILYKASPIYLVVVAACIGGIWTYLAGPLEETTIRDPRALRCEMGNGEAKSGQTD